MLAHGYDRGNKELIIMEFVKKIENAIAKIAKDLPHLPSGGSKWLGENVWWIIAVTAGVAALASLISFINIIQAANALSALSAFVPLGGVSTWAITTAIVNLVLVVVQVAVLAFAIQPLKAKQRKGWSLLFTATIISAISIIASAVLSLDVLALILQLIFGGVILAAVVYFVFEIRGEFKEAPKAPAKK